MPQAAWHNTHAFLPEGVEGRRNNIKRHSMREKERCASSWPAKTQCCTLNT